QLQALSASQVVIGKAIGRKTTICCPKTLIGVVLIVVTCQSGHFMVPKGIVIIQGQLTIVPDIVIRSTGSETSLTVLCGGNVFLGLIETPHIGISLTGIKSLNGKMFPKIIAQRKIQTGIPVPVLSDGLFNITNRVIIEIDVPFIPVAVRIPDRLRGVPDNGLPVNV